MCSCCVALAGTGIADVHAIYDGIDECSLSKFNATVAMLSDDYSDVISWMSLIFYIKTCGRNLMNNVSQFLVIRSQENPIINTSNKNDIITEKYALIN